MVKTTLAILLILFIQNCSNPTEATDSCSECRLEISADLPKDEHGMYVLEYRQGTTQTFCSLYASTDCGWSKPLSWDSDLVFYYGGQHIPIVNRHSMTSDDGTAQTTMGVWSVFIGEIVTIYAGYVDDCEEHHVDSIRIKII